MSDASNSSGKPAPRARRDVTPPAHVPANMSLFDYLSKCTPPLVDKIVDIACSQVQVPPSLRDDARQEISIMWAQQKPDTKQFKPGQIASYAHHMARHTALRVRRDLGAPVRLPGSAFRKRKDGTSYVTPGVLSEALDWNEMESWFQTEGAQDSPGSAALRDDFNQVSMTGLDEPAAEESAEEQALAERQEILRASKEVLTDRQLQIMTLLVEGHSYEDVMTRLQIKRGVLMREISIATSVMVM